MFEHDRMLAKPHPRRFIGHHWQPLLPRCPAITRDRGRDDGTWNRPEAAGERRGLAEKTMVDALHLPWGALESTVPSRLPVARL